MASPCVEEHKENKCCVRSAHSPEFLPNIERAVTPQVYTSCDNEAGSDVRPRAGSASCSQETVPARLTAANIF